MKLPKVIETSTLFVIIALFFGLIFIKLTPPLWGTDETAHFARVYQLAHGGLLVKKDVNGVYSSEAPKSLVDLRNYVKEDLIDNKAGGILNRKDVDNESTYKKLTAVSFSKQKEKFPETAFYAPFAYPGSILGVLLASLIHADIGETIFLARIGSLLVYVAIVAVAIHLLRNSKLKWLIFTVALLPISVYQASVVTADSLALALSIVFVALFVRLLKNDKSQLKLFFWLGMITLLLPLVKLNYVFLGAGLVLVPSNIFKTKRAALIAKAALIIGALLISFTWTSLSKVAANSPISQRSDGAQVVASAQTSFIIHHPLNFIVVCARTIIENADSYLQSMTALVGWNYIALPFILIYILMFAVAISAIYAKAELIPIRRTLLVLSGSVLVGIISIFGVLYITFNPTANRLVDGVQGRYFVPFLIPIAMSLAACTPIEIKIKEKVTPYIFGGICTICLVATTAYYYLMTY